jgi:hypothetical protein
MKHLLEFFDNVFYYYEDIDFDGISLFSNREILSEKEALNIKKQTSEVFKRTEIGKFLFHATDYIWKAEYMGEQVYVGIIDGGIDNTLKSEVGYLASIEVDKQNEQTTYRVVILKIGRTMLRTV